MAKSHFRCDYSKYQSEPCWNAVCIPLTHGQHAIIDADDWHLVSGMLFHAVPRYHKISRKTSYYVQCRNGYSRRQNYLHRIVMNPTDSALVDHINRNPLDNRKCNLRICDTAQNSWNSGSKRGSSKYKGVSFAKPAKKWKVAIIIRGKSIYIGSFDCEKIAAYAYNAAARKYHGEFAVLNIVE